MCYELREDGQTALVALLSIGVIVLILGVSVAVRGSIASLAGRRATLADDAFFASQAGVEDALRKLNQDKDYTTSSEADIGCIDTVANEYQLTVGSATTCIEVKDDPSDSDARNLLIISRANREDVSKTVQLKVKVDGVTADVDPLHPCNIDGNLTCDPGKITVISWSEL